MLTECFASSSFPEACLFTYRESKDKGHAYVQEKARSQGLMDVLRFRPLQVRHCGVLEASANVVAHYDCQTTRQVLHPVSM